MDDKERKQLWDAIKDLNNRLDSIIAEKVKTDWITLDSLAQILKITVQGAYYRLFHTQGVEPEKDFVMVNGKYHIKPSVVARLQK
jgi:hypothetical protein